MQGKLKFERKSFETKEARELLAWKYNKRMIAQYVTSDIMIETQDNLWPLDFGEDFFIAFFRFPGSTSELSHAKIENWAIFPSRKQR